MDNNYLKNENEGLCLYVKVIPGSPKNQISGFHDGLLKVKISSPPEKGKANSELISFLSKVLNIPKKHIVLLKGDSKQKKKILLKGIPLTKADNMVRNFLQRSV